jgi:adenylyltransferase/sulfurtransferase
VLGPIVNVIASYQAAEALKLLAGKTDTINRELLYIDVWENVNRRIKIAPLLGKVDCPCCQRRKFEWLDGAHGSQTTSLCGRNAVQVSHRSATKLNFEELARQLSASGSVSHNRFLLKFNVDDYEFTVFPDGRAIIKGTADTEKARTLYAKYIGH